MSFCHKAIKGFFVETAGFLCDAEIRDRTTGAELFECIWRHAQVLTCLFRVKSALHALPLPTYCRCCERCFFAYLAINCLKTAQASDSSIMLVRGNMSVVPFFSTMISPGRRPSGIPEAFAMRNRTPVRMRRTPIELMFMIFLSVTVCRRCWVLTEALDRIRQRRKNFDVINCMMCTRRFGRVSWCAKCW